MLQAISRQGKWREKCVKGGWKMKLNKATKESCDELLLLLLMLMLPAA